MIIALIIFPKVNEVPHQSPFSYAEIIEEDTKNNFFIMNLSYQGYISSNEFTPIFTEDYTTCLNKDIASSFFENKIVTLEWLSRLPLDEDGNIIHSENGVSYLERIQKKTYQEALLLYTQYKHNLVDLCFTFDNTLIAIKDNRILTSSINDNSINDIINYYFK